MGNTPSVAHCAGAESPPTVTSIPTDLDPALLASLGPMPEGGAASGDGGGAAGGGGGGADALAGLGGLGALGGALGAAGGGAGAAPRAQLPNPGKFDEADGACSQVMDFQTWDGVTIEYTKQANHSQVAQLQMAHGIKLGNARTEGYSLTTTYASQSLFMQGVTSSNLDLQGVLLAQDFLPGMTFKFQPGMGIESGGGEINQATFELTSKGTDWAATVSVTPSAQTHALATYMQSLTKKWSAGFKIEGISVAVPQGNEPLTDMLAANLKQMLWSTVPYPSSPHITMPKLEALVRFNGPKSTVVASLTTPFPGDGYMPNPMLPPGTSQVGYGWLSQVIWGFPRLRASYIHRLGDAQPGMGSAVTLGTDIDLGIDAQTGLIDSTARVGWTYNMRMTSLQGMQPVSTPCTLKSTIDSNWKVKCLFESHIVPNALTFNLAAMLDHGAKPPGTKQAASSFGFGMTIHV